MKLAREIPKSHRSGLLDSGDSLNQVYATLAGPGDELDEQKPYWTLDDWNALPQPPGRPLLLRGSIAAGPGLILGFPAGCVAEYKTPPLGKYVTPFSLVRFQAPGARLATATPSPLTPSPALQ
jgi:hypothetical protein